MYFKYYSLKIERMRSFLCIVKLGFSRGFHKFPRKIFFKEYIVFMEQNLMEFILANPKYNNPRSSIS